MSQILDLRDKRAKAWNTAKEFLDEKSKDGKFVSAEDAETYDRMEQDVVDYGKQIERLERQAAIDAEMAKAVTEPIKNAPEVNGALPEKKGRASDRYKKAFWDNMRTKNYLDIQDALSIGTDSEG